MAETKEQKNARARKRYATLEGGEKHRARVRKWRKKNPDAEREIARRCRYKVAPTRLEPEWCECCGRLPETTLCFDHNHITGAFRGWLCRPCNAAIGALGDDRTGLLKAIAYLDKAGGV